MHVVSGETNINDVGIKKRFKNSEPFQSIIELAWNGFDARAKNVSIVLQRTELGGMQSLFVLDDGDGIDIDDFDSNFNRFDDSLKKDSIDQHGSQGRGRLAFHKLSHSAIWFTKFKKISAKIEINSASIKSYQAYIDIANHDQHPQLLEKNSGTCVVLDHFHNELPTDNEIIKRLQNEFCCHLALNENLTLSFNGEVISAPEHDFHSFDTDFDGSQFAIKALRWNEKPAKERSYVYLVNSKGKKVHEVPSKFNLKKDFHLSIFVTSDWADTFSSKGDDIFSTAKSNPTSSTWKELIKFVWKISKDIYDDFLKKKLEETLERYQQEGVFPTYSEYSDRDYADWKLGNIKAIVRDIYIADPTLLENLNIKQRKIFVRLLDKISDSNNNEDLFNILESILDLSKEGISKFSDQLRLTKLDNIISTIEELQKRRLVVDKLRHLMDFHYKEIKETPDLQKIIENNTWLFGERYETMGAEEDTFTKIAKQLRNNIPEINIIEEHDVEDISELEGAQRQTDLFLARKFPCLDSNGKPYFKCIIIEIKKPSISLNVKHLRQLDDYAAILQRHPGFRSQNLHFELILIGRKISKDSFEIESRMNSHIQKGDMGLVADDVRMKRYVKNWYTIFDSFDLTNRFMLEKLKLERDAIEIAKLDEKTSEDIVTSLQNDV
ncbi:histidine kinase/DNA gyrase B/HSP90-like ATPase [Rahnella sp. JUb53]|uniref:ATP-binding protein n=1 Tax=Rahnella sp. JUb53 TaxID=2485128 RepID=UPI00104FFAB2|nr:ATP-binding protein [Rahnella sp. JUb53]TCQ89568.1 histidine kinase/DNA gyrase B/HSP90-like ATPase [Rahnella sp. JUb53]